MRGQCVTDDFEYFSSNICIFNTFILYSYEPVNLTNNMSQEYILFYQVDYFWIVNNNFVFFNNVSYIFKVYSTGHRFSSLMYL